MKQVTNNLSPSIPLFYKYTEMNSTNLNQTQQAFTMHLNSYLLLRFFIFYLLKKQLVILPTTLASIPSFRPDAMSDESINPCSPIPIDIHTTQQSILSPEMAAAVSELLGMTVNELAKDVQLEKTVNLPSIAVSQKVEISRVNKYDWFD